MLDLTNKRQAHIDARLRSNIIIWLSSVKPNGGAHIVPVWYYWDGEFVYIYSKPDQKIRNIAQNTLVMLGIDNTNEGADPIMIAGEAEIRPREEALTTQPGYVEKYQSRLDSFKWTGESMAQEYSEPIKIKPTKFL